MDEQSVRHAVIQAYYAAHNVHDAEAVAALYTEDGVHEDVALGHVRSGREALRTGLSGFFALFEGLRLEERTRILSADHAVAVHTLSGRVTRDLGPMRLAGREVSLTGAYLFDFSGDRIARSRDYWNLAELKSFAAP